MKKLFLAVCFSLVFLSSNLWAATTEINNAEELRAREAQAPVDNEPIIDPRIPTGENPAEMDAFIKERMKTVVITTGSTITMTVKPPVL